MSTVIQLRDAQIAQNIRKVVDLSLSLSLSLSPPSLPSPSKDTCWVINIRLLAHEEGVCTEKLRYQNGHQRSMVIA